MLLSRVEPVSFKFSAFCIPGSVYSAIARPEACPLGMQASPSHMSIPTSGTFFSWRLGHEKKKNLRPFFLFR